MHLFCFQVDGPITGRGLSVMIRFSARGAYLLLAPQRRALIRVFETGRLFGTGRLFNFLRNNQMFKTKF